MSTQDAMEKLQRGIWGSRFVTVIGGEEAAGVPSAKGHVINVGQLCSTHVTCSWPNTGQQRPDVVRKLDRSKAGRRDLRWTHVINMLTIYMHSIAGWIGSEMSVKF